MSGKYDIDRDLTIRRLKAEIAELKEKAAINRAENHVTHETAKCDKCRAKDKANKMFFKSGRYCQRCYASRNLSPEDFDDFIRRAKVGR